MAYIYLITNNINGKSYVGKTYHQNIQQRWREHCLDRTQERNKNRPLYKAMNKYGIENFSIHLIEETNQPEEREKYWIKYYNSYEKGYNATLGGDGKPYLDLKLIKQKWDEGLTCIEISRELKYDSGQVSKHLKNMGITADEIKNRGNQKHSIPVKQIDKINNQVIANYPSFISAAYAMIEQNYTRCKPSTGASHIAEVCRGKRKTFAGFKWEI